MQPVKFYCIADEDTVRGFRLAGVAGQVATTARQAAAAVETAAAHADCGIIVLTEKVAAGIREQVDVIRLAHTRPLIVEIPGPEGPLPGRKSLRRFVQEAVGLRVG
jgi:V/A-type H+/Na+-transporting ATPase subunit F